MQNLDSNKHLLDKIIFSQTTNNIVHGKLIFWMSSWFRFEIAIYFFPKRRKGSTYAYFNFNSNICCHLNALMCWYISNLVTISTVIYASTLKYLIPNCQFSIVTGDEIRGQPINFVIQIDIKCKLIIDDNRWYVFYKWKYIMWYIDLATVFQYVIWTLCTLPFHCPVYFCICTYILNIM